MDLRPSEISALIKEQIKNYDTSLEMNDVGYVIRVGDGIALIQGLQSAMAGELLLFDNDVYGMVLNLEEDHVGAVILGDDSKIKENDEVRRTNRIVEVPVGDGMLGRVVNALGQPIDGAGPIKAFFKITVPLLRPTILLTTIMSINGTLQLFDESVNLTNGGPANSTLTMSHYIYKASFEYNPQFGYAAAMSYVIFILVAVLSFIQMKVGDKR